MLILSFSLQIKEKWAELGGVWEKKGVGSAF